MNEYAKHPDPNAFTLRIIRKGEEYSKSVKGGFIRAKAPAAGVVLVSDDREVFVPSDRVAVTLVLLGYKVTTPTGEVLR